VQAAHYLEDVSGFTSTAASPTTSGSEEVFEVTTGVPWPCLERRQAETLVQDGNTNTLAASVEDAQISMGTNPET